MLVLMSKGLQLRGGSAGLPGEKPLVGKGGAAFRTGVKFFRTGKPQRSER